MGLSNLFLIICAGVVIAFVSSRVYRYFSKETCVHDEYKKGYCSKCGITYYGSMR